MENARESISRNSVETKRKPRNIETSCARVNKKQTNRTKSILFPLGVAHARLCFSFHSSTGNTFQCPFPRRYTIKRFRVRKCWKAIVRRRAEPTKKNEVDRKRRKVTFYLLLFSTFSTSSFFPTEDFFFTTDLELEMAILPSGRVHLIREECASFVERVSQREETTRRKIIEVRGRL